MANLVIYNKYGRAQPNVAIKGKAQWSAVRMVQNGDPTDGGANGAVNYALQALVDRTEYLKQTESSSGALQVIVDELNKLRRYVYSNTPDGVQKMRLQMSRDAPNDTNFAWIEANVDTTLDPDLLITLNGGQVLSLIDSGSRITVDGKIYEFASAQSMGLVDVTIPSALDETDDGFPDVEVGEVSIPADDTLPADDTTSGGDEPVTVECGCCEHESISVAQINQSIDNLFNNL